MAIVTYPDNRLFQKSTNATIEEAIEIEKLLKREIKELKWGKVVGLAAPQIGINKNVFLALNKLYINPKITKRSWFSNTCLEGCYSLEENKFDYKVKRNKNIRIEWLDKKGRKHVEDFDGFTAQVLQHEYDHLLGKLCCNQ